jgi:signal transduction histidine kinase/CheY-like chemotaxis protein
LNVLDDTSKKIIRSFTSLITKKIEPFKLLQLNATAAQKNNVLAIVSSYPAKQLTDSIYVTALKIQMALEKNLRSTIIKNEALSVTVLSFSRILGFVSIAAIAILASIVIRRLIQNFKLIKALENARIQAEKVSDIKEQFLANMSHEIRTPVNAVLGFTNLLQKTPLQQDQNQFVGLIKTAGQNLLNIINDILDISKIESGMLHFDKNAFNLRELCYTVEMMFYHHLSEQQLLFNCIISDDVPELIAGDKERLTQIFTNLVNNAIKFTKEGEITISISVISKTEKTVRLSFSVEDTGIGIKEDKLEKIFERFEQAEASTTRNYGGTGLGLSIVKNLVNMQGGSITAKSTYGAGAAFIFDLEFETGKEEFYNPVANDFIPALTRLDTIKSMSGLHVLAAEDNKMNQKLLAYIFQEWDLTYEFAETGKQAIEKLKDGNFDLVLMDIQMPEMDGYEASEKIRQQLSSAIPIIAMTANVLPGEKEKCKKIGINDYISKPLNEKILYDLIVKNIPAGFTTTNNFNAAAPLINLPYLNKIFSGNTLFIKDILQQFSAQYPIELAELEKAVESMDLPVVKSRCHHIKTTISTVNSGSFMLDHLEVMEKAGSTPGDWEIIQHKMDMLLHFKDAFLKEAGDIVYSQQPVA